MSVTDKEIAAAATETDRDELPERLALARQWSGRGTLRQRREMWRFCGRAFREWHGIQYLTDVPIVPERRLTRAEMLAWLELADQLPGVARDVLRLQKDARSDNTRLALRMIPWTPERRRMLIELHQHGVQMAAGAWQEARRAIDDASKKGQGFERQLKYWVGILAGIERWQSELSEQLQALQGAGRS